MPIGQVTLIPVGLTQATFWWWTEVRFPGMSPTRFSFSFHSRSRIRRSKPGLSRNSEVVFLVYLRETLRDFVYIQTAATDVFEYNLACIAMSGWKFSRHIDIWRYFVRKLVKANIVKLIPLCTHKMVNHAVTKSLPSPAFILHRKVMLGQVPFSLQLLGTRHTCISTRNNLQI